jgi:hypothetical protein
MQAQFQQYQEPQQVILEGIRQQQEAQRQQMLQHQMMTSQMFTFMHVWMPRSALLAVRDAATSATDHCPASG